MYLVDTNVWIELFLNQEKSLKVSRFLTKTDTSLISISGFSLYSIGVILSRLKKLDVLRNFLDDVITLGHVNVLYVKPEEIFHLIDIQKEFAIDFDDSYQYFISKKYNLTLVSFDKDFKKTDITLKSL